jgi:hydrogenase maturation protein HypF
MAKDIDTVAKYCQLTIEAREILESPLAPILILPTRKKNLPQEVAPGVDTVGVMLPYTPLHLMLFAQGLELLVATSANISGEPLLYQDQSLTALADMADYLVIHNRRIYNRCDDSVLKVIAEKPRLLRRARGYVPLPLEIPEQVSVLACGGDLNNTFCLTEGREAFLSQHMGDLQNYNNLKEYELAVKRFCNYFNIHPELVIVDKHPGYVSHSWGLEQGTDYLEVQHHHAHLASCLADNGLAERILGVICDGTGYGQDGNLWGLEFLIGDFSAFQRVAHLEYVPQPGGERAIFEPLRMAISHIYLALGKSGLDFINNFLKPMSNGIFTDQEFSLLIKQIDLGINAPLTSSCGRLFDAVSALLGICREVSYEGEAAIKLEAISSSGKNLKSYDYDFKKDDGECLILIPKEIWSGIIKDLKSGRKKDEIAGRFHLTVVDMIVETCCRLRYLLDSNKVLLSGGVMQNKILVEKLVEKLIRNNFIPLLHSRVPSGDGGISLGQAVIGGRLAAICGNAP